MNAGCRLLPVPAAAVLEPGRDRLDHVRLVHRAGLPADLRAAAGRLSAKLSNAIAADPIGALTTLLPTWFLIPFAIVAVLGLVGGSVLDIYSSGLSLLTLGVRIPRYAAALIDGTVMILGTIYVVFVAHNFLPQFQGFLITLGVPIAAWCGIMLADIMLRHKDYSEPELYDRRGRYGDIRFAPLAIIVIATAIGWGLVTNTYAELAHLAGLPARPARPGRQDRCVGVRQPGRAGGAGARVRRGVGAGHRAGPVPGVPARAGVRGHRVKVAA